MLVHEFSNQTKQMDGKYAAHEESSAAIMQVLILRLIVSSQFFTTESLRGAISLHSHWKSYSVIVTGAGMSQLFVARVAFNMINLITMYLNSLVLKTYSRISLSRYVSLDCNLLSVYNSYMQIVLVVPLQRQTAIEVGIIIIIIIIHYYNT